MSDSRFKSFLERMGKFGFEMDDRLEQKSVNGLLGMYASQAIPQGTLLGKFPISMMIPRSESIEFEDGPNKETQSLVHALAIQLADKESPYQCYFEYCGDLAEREDRSVCFFKTEDFSALDKMNPLLAQMAITSRNSWEHLIQTVATKDPSLDKDPIMLASLIYRERCWGEGLGFLPGIDLFNHNTHSQISPQRALINDEKCLVLIADKDIAAGEEIKITYGRKDMFKFAFNYDFFDPSDFHIISYSARITQAISDAFVLKIVENLQQHYPVHIFEANGVQKFAINESSAYFLEQGPNSAMVDLVSRLAISNEVDLKRGHADEKTTARYMLYILQSFKNANKSLSISRDSVPEKLRSFHDMLVAELAILDANIKVVEPRCA